MRFAIAYIAGLIFGLGISVSGMGNPAKVQNFFDFAGTFDPSLAFVMAGALGIAFAGYRLVLSKPAPLLDRRFHLPAKREITRELIFGSALFGIGWGLAGFCPGGALPMLGTGNRDVVLFVLAMGAGIVAAKFIIHLRLKREEAEPRPSGA